jgi:hypothetical protein
MHFGLYLKKQGVITAEQLVAAIEAQMSTLVPIGQLALEEGVLSARDIFNILRAQNDAPNVRFGELAVEMGLMTRDDVMRLLMIQADRKRPIAEILVGQGVLTEEQMETEFMEYRAAQRKPKRAAATMDFVSLPRRKETGPMNIGTIAEIRN